MKKATVLLTIPLAILMMSCILLGLLLNSHSKTIKNLKLEISNLENEISQKNEVSTNEYIIQKITMEPQKEEDAVSILKILLQHADYLAGPVRNLEIGNRNVESIYVKGMTYFPIDSKTCYYKKRDDLLADLDNTFDYADDLKSEIKYIRNPLYYRDIDEILYCASPPIGERIACSWNTKEIVSISFNSTKISAHMPVIIDGDNYYATLEAVRIKDAWLLTNSYFV